MVRTIIDNAPVIATFPRPVLLIMLALLAAPVAALEHVEVRALFGNAAMLHVDGEKKLVRVGDPAFRGVSLVSADTEKAVVEYEGEQHTLYLSDLIGTRFETPEQVRVIVPMNEKRQYIAHGSVNGRTARFLVDTGANIVAINAADAKRLGISTEGGRKTHASTASDSARATLVTVQEIRVGDIRRNNVRALVMEGEYPRDILLGMTFLDQVEIREDAGIMVLTSKM